MWAWLASNRDALSVVLQFLTLLVWALYFQLFLSNFRHQKRPRILINVGAGKSLEARCLVTNMSAEPVYVEAVVVALGFGDAAGDFSFTCSLSGLDLQTTEKQDPRSQWYQGPLHCAEYLNVGSFRWIIERSGACDEKGAGNRDSLEGARRIRLTVLGSYTADSRTIAAERVFDIVRTEAGQHAALKPRTLATRQITSFWRRRDLDRLLSKT